MNFRQFYKLDSIIVDDFSTDGSRELLKNNIDGVHTKVIYQNMNQGKGAALSFLKTLAAGSNAHRCS